MKIKNPILYSVVITILGVALNFLFEILPDSFKDSVSNFSNEIGLSYTWFWIICTSILVLLLLYFVWQQAINEEKKTTKDSSAPNIKRYVMQCGKKSTYIEKNNGNIKIK